MAVGSQSSASAIKAGEAFVELFADDSEFKQGLERATDKFKTFVTGIRTLGIGGSIKALGVSGILGGVASGLKSAGDMLAGVGKKALFFGSSVVGAFAATSYSALEYIDQLQDIADRTDTSIESVSRLAYAAKLSATSIEDVEAANKILTKSTLAAKDGSEEQASAFRKMKIEAEDFAELEIDEKFAMIAGTLESLEDPIDKNRFLFALFGKQAAALVPLLGDGSAALRKLFDEAGSLGAVIRTEDGKKAAATMDAFDKVMTSVKSTLIEVGLAIFSFGGDLEEGTRVVLLYLKMARDWVKENKRLVAIIVIVSAVVAAVGAALLAVAAVVAIVGGAITGLVAIVTAVGAVLAAITVKGIIIAAVILGVVAAIVALTYAFLKFSGIGEKLVKIFGDAFKDIGEQFKVMWSGIVGAFKKGDFETIGQLLTVGLFIAWERMVVSMKKGWHEFTNYFVEAWYDAISLLNVYWTKLISFIKSSGFEAIKMIADSSITLFGALNIKELNELKDAIQGFRDKVQKAIDEEMKAQVKAEAKIFLEAELLVKKRKEKQKEEVDKDLEGIERLKAALKRLEEKANAPEPAKEGLPVAPMPRKIDRAKELVGTLGDSVKGLFNSADYAGALAIGEQNSYAKQALDINKDMLAELKLIREKVGEAVFT